MSSTAASGAEGVAVFRAAPDDIDAAYSIVSEYCDAVDVVVRDEYELFRQSYFVAGSGVWLAKVGSQIVGCIALRALRHMHAAAEVKRLYVQPVWRRTGIADRLLASLEAYAATFGYEYLYLDTKDDLDSAIRFYQNRRYEPCERYNDNPQATLFMRKRIRS